VSNPSASESIIEDLAVIDLAAGRYTARFLPDRGLVGSSLTFDGAEYLQPDLDGLAGGHPSGIPLLHPWANRLSRRSYEARSTGVWVDLDGQPPQHLLDGMPIHGTMLGAPGWRVEAVLADGTRALLQARFVFGEHDAQLRSFPFPHEIVVFVELSDQGLRVSTEIRNTGTRPVPVAFGWHPVLVLPEVPRADLAVSLPDREHVELDGRGLPTGSTRTEVAERVSFGSLAAGDGPGREGLVRFDDCYRLLGDAPLAVEATGIARRVELQVLDGYDYVQVWAPPDSPAVALEPMTAPVDALVTGEHRVVAPGGVDTAIYVIRIRDLSDPEIQRSEEPAP
jgi:aldose 1-epimerase